MTEDDLKGRWVKPLDTEPRGEVDCNYIRGENVIVCKHNNEKFKIKGIVVHKTGSEKNDYDVINYDDNY